MHENPKASEDYTSFMDKVKKTRWTYLSNDIADPKTLVVKLLPVKTDNRTGNRRIFPYLAYAASLLILAGFLWYFLYLSDKTEIETTHHEAPALERQNRALLVLSDGTSLELDKSGSAEMTDEGGVKITNLPGEILRYEQADTSTDEQPMNRLIVPAGARYQLQLSDGTKVWMNAESELEYPVSFSANQRSVRLTGEAFFEVKENKNAPFKIEANGYEIVVYGTSLNISAYSNDSFIQTTLVTGALEVNNREGNAFRLDPGQMAMISHNDQ
jgi:ferric-dicitrate binding protein FerR (iron transport regulator)